MPYFQRHSVGLKRSPGCESHPDIWADEPQPKTARPVGELLFLHPYQFPENVQNITFSAVGISSHVYSIVAAAICMYTAMKTWVNLTQTVLGNV